MCKQNDSWEGTDPNLPCWSDDWKKTLRYQVIYIELTELIVSIKDASGVILWVNTNCGSFRQEPPRGQRMITYDRMSHTCYDEKLDKSKDPAAGGAGGLWGEWTNICLTYQYRIILTVPVSGIIRFKVIYLSYKNIVYFKRDTKWGTVVWHTI